MQTKYYKFLLIVVGLFLTHSSVSAKDDKYRYFAEVCGGSPLPISKFGYTLFADATAWVEFPNYISVGLNYSRGNLLVNNAPKTGVLPKGYSFNPVYVNKSDAQMDIFSLRASYTMNSFFKNRLTPYLYAGTGMYLFNLETTYIDGRKRKVSNKSYISYVGVGVRHFFTDLIAVGVSCEFNYPQSSLMDSDMFTKTDYFLTAKVGVCVEIPFKH